MEAAAAAPLFKRGARGVRLTEAGRVLLRHAGGVLDQLETAQRELAGVRDLATGRLRVGPSRPPSRPCCPAPWSLSARSTRASTCRCARGLPLHSCVASGPERRSSPSSGRPDGPPNDDRFAFEPLLDDPLLLAVARDDALARRRSVNLHDLANERWIAASPNASDTFLGVWESLPWQPQVEFVAREWTAKLGLVAAGLGVTLVPGVAATAVREDVALVRVRSQQPAMRSVILATRAGGEPRPHARAFADVLHEVAAELAVELQRRIQDR
jgi:DNA-binding transcriptional LysR family regulator